MAKRAFSILSALVLLLAASCGAPPGGPGPSESQQTSALPPSRQVQLGAGGTVYWIGADDNTLFDEKTIRSIARSAGLVVLNLLPKGNRQGYDYKNIVSRLKSANPALPVLLYAWPSRWYDTPRISSSYYREYPALGEMLVSDSNGNPIIESYMSLCYGDVRNPKYREWITKKILAAVDDTMTDGVAFDMALRDPEYFLPSKCSSSPDFCPEYAEGMEELMLSLYKSLYPRVVAYNGLWNSAPGLLDEQKKLLPYADVATIEWFGRNPWQAYSFKDGILDFVELIREHPEKTFLVFGNGSIAYRDFDEEYLWQRYLYASYLLAARQNTLFKYLTIFTYYPDTARSGSFDTYSDWAADLGGPLGGYETDGALYYRRFVKGLVIVAPHDGPGGSHTLPTRMYTPEGEAVEGVLNLSAGTALILTYQNAQKTDTFYEGFGSSTSPYSGWLFSSIAEEGGGRFLRLEATPSGQEAEHDLSLSDSKWLRNPPFLSFRARTLSEGSKVLLVAEIDDMEKKYSKAVVVVSPNGTGSAVYLGPGIAFRYLANISAKPYINAASGLLADGLWHDIKISGGDIFSKTGRYTFKRWSFARFAGNLDVDEISTGWR